MRGKRRLFEFLPPLALTVLLGCAEPPPAEDPELARIERRAEHWLALARREAWEELTTCVLVERWHDGAWVQVRLEDDAHPQHAELQSRASQLLQQLYGRGRSPGSIEAVRIETDNPDRKPPLPRARVTYRHGDFDAFEMARMGQAWYWVVTLWD